MNSQGERLAAMRQAATTIRQHAEFRAGRLVSEASEIAAKSGATGTINLRDAYADAVALFCDMVLGMLDEYENRVEVATPRRRRLTEAEADEAVRAYKAGNAQPRTKKGRR